MRVQTLPNSTKRFSTDSIWIIPKAVWNAAWNLVLPLVVRFFRRDIWRWRIWPIRMIMLWLKVVPLPDIWWFEKWFLINGHLKQDRKPFSGQSEVFQCVAYYERIQRDSMASVIFHANQIQENGKHEACSFSEPDFRDSEHYTHFVYVKVLRRLSFSLNHEKIPHL